MSAILDERNQIDNSSKKKLRGRLTSGTVALLIALLAVISATYAWYVYNTGRHTTKVRMAAGAGDAKPIQELELSNIDVSAEQKYKDIVFVCTVQSLIRVITFSWHILQISDLPIQSIKLHWRLRMVR